MGAYENLGRAVIGFLVVIGLVIVALIAMAIRAARRRRRAEMTAHEAPRATLPEARVTTVRSRTGSEQ